MRPTANMSWCNEYMDLMCNALQALKCPSLEDRLVTSPLHLGLAQYLLGGWILRMRYRVLAQLMNKVSRGRTIDQYYRAVRAGTANR